ncbi:MAG TPA: glycolate oxidase subunit GlcE [Caldimonas sp.]|jgi:glycolate oxidase FAD binding subunit|nr:glycolate oxidase subunit GlcE [Caldimonas sp.]HEX4233022.1 glycolate oxidase subunit GlcE [Caldimonas sp.]
MDAAVAAIIERVRDAHAHGEPLRVRGGGSKDFYGETPIGAVLDTTALVGSADHEPTELVVTAPAGMTVVDLETQLASHGQCLAFEPPRFTPGTTVGGMVAAGLAGPSRAAAGSVRDHVLGMTLVSGTGELLQFGGRVIKNVAGYDVSRLVTGSLGILGVVVEVSLKVLSHAEAEATLRFDCKPGEALARLHAWGARPLPLDASAWWNGNLIVRLRGSMAAVDEAARTLGGESIAAAAAAPFWQSLRDHTDPFFVAAQDAIDHQDATLWRLSLPQTAPLLGLAGDELIEWHGAQRWLATALPAAQVREAAAAAGGHATAFRCRDKAAGAFTPLAPPLRAIHERLKHAFDPKRILNPGRLYPGL